MEIGNKRHGKKSDKETQSPVLKVFKEMIQRENNDPEKANLLKEKQENRKRRQYSGSRSKTNRVNRSCDSSSSEKNKRSVQYKVAHEQRLKDYNERSQSIPFQGDKKDSWWFWGDNQNKRSEDTCSCVSCALKKIVSSEYTCIACLGILFLISVLVAFMVLFRTVPMVAKTGHPNLMPGKKPREGSDVLKRKIDLIQRGCKDDERRLWDDTLTRHLSSLTGLNGNDFDDGNYRETNSLEESGLDSGLSSVLDADKLNDGLSSERLRNFYKKLIQTDAQIRNLKKGANEYAPTNYENKFNPDRSKRSLRIRNPKALLRYNSKKEVDNVQTDNDLLTDNNGPSPNVAELNKFNIFYPPYSSVNVSNKNNKYKRFVNGSDEPTGFVIEKKQILVQYKPHDTEKQKKVPKCSHAPKDSKSHEKQLKHPFYKNSQRLDELLDQFLDKSLPEMMADPFGVDVLFKHKNKDVKTHKTNVKIENEKTTKKAISKFKYKDENKLFGTHRGDSRVENNRVGEKRVGELDREFFNMISSKKKGKTSSSSATPSYDVILSVSTIVNNGQRKISKPMNVMGHTPSLLERVPHLRKLMQVEEEDEEGLGYEDVNEVLADDNEGHDDTDKGQDRKKRMDDYKVEDFKVPSNPYKYNPPGVHNPNWKGPMPLYPDELSSMIKQAAMQNVQNFNKIYLPANTKDASSEADNSETELNDMEYIENYSDNKFENLARMAQAYSDYGVLEGRKEQSRNEKAMDGKNAERRIKLSVKGRSFKDALFDRFKKSKVSEGIRFEIRPTTPSREDSPIELMKVLEKHVKVTKNKYFPPFHSTTLPLNTDYALFSAIQKQQSQMMANEASTKKGEQPNEYPDNAVVFTLAKSGRRSLKSVPDEENYKSNEEFVENEKSLEDKLIVKGISGLGTIKADDKPSNDKNTKTAEEHHHHHHKHHHHSDHHHHNISSVNESTSKLEIIEEKSLILNETDRIKENVTSNHASDSHSNGLAVIPDNNLIATILNLNAPRNKSEMDLSDFFMLMSNWFSVMAGLDTSSETNEPKSNIIKLITKSDASTTPTSNDSINIEFPMYDSDMIENIGHRSRVLMAIEDSDKSTENAVSEVNTSVMNGKYEITSASPVITINKEDVSTATALTSATETITAIATQSEPAEKLILTKNEETFDNKTVVKRNIPEDSNLIFWNDIYDDEYGVKMEPIDNTVIDKRNSKNLNFMKKSGDWIHEKVKNIANNFRGKDKFESKYKTKQRRVMRRANYRNDMYTKYNKRAARYEEADADEKTGSFAQLTVKMKEVCKEAAKAVQQTKNVQVRQDEKEDSMTTSLMQQLVRLMTDLIDFQVQQKTCVKLPPDLQDFLVWLTNPNSDQEVEFRDQKMSYREDNNYEKPSDQILDLISTPSSEKEETHGDSRSECLGTLHAVQDLMQQYDEMTDEDKSKMTGIRDYLENQLQFLHKQLATFNDYKMSNIFEDQNPSYRFRREVPKQNCRRRSNQIRSRRNRNRFKRKFLKNFGKKHTRTTASIYDGFAMTEVNKFTKDDKYGAENDGKDGKNVKRNLKDVYYKALNDAKKSTTFKTASKDEMEGFDHAQIVRMDN